MCGVVLRDQSERERSGKGRRVFLSGQDLPSLFGRYVDAIRKKGLAPDWSTLQVAFVDPSQRRIELAGEKLKFGETMLGLSDITKWKKRLKQQAGVARERPLSDAEASSDVVCER
jgi:hypothetical protein